MAYSRASWGAVGSVPRDTAHKTELFIHHTVSPNRSWTAPQERAQMRAFERQHISQGWQTIGYSYVLFPSGRLYEGRGKSGLPAAQKNHNTGTVAIAFVGTFSGRLPTLKSRLRFLAASRNLKRQLPLRRLGGHRDVFATSCPGSTLYGKVPKYARLLGLKRV